MEQALAAFRAWALAHIKDNEDLENLADAPAVDLSTLLGQHVALRQEVHLQTRAVRAQQEQTAEALRAVQTALEAFGRPSPRPDRDRPDEIVRPLLSTLAELHDALSRAGREIIKAQARLAPALELPAAEAEALLPRRPWWARWRRRQAGNAEADRLRARLEEARHAVIQAREGLDALVAGYEMSLDRVERALRRHGLEPLLCVGEVYDPESMEAVEAVAGSGRPAGEVIEEVRRGYLLNGRVFRTAQVRVARGERPGYEEKS